RGADVTVEAAVGEIDARAVGRVAGAILSQGGAGDCAGTRHQACEPCSHRLSPQRGAVTTSTSAGWPLFTVAIARLSAGPRSFGSVIGPSPCTPKPFATVA